MGEAGVVRDGAMRELAFVLALLAAFLGVPWAMSAARIAGLW